MPTPPAPPVNRRSAKNRPLSGVLTGDGRREAVVVTALEKRLVINVEADISAIPLARVRRDDGLNLRRTDNKDWQIRFDTVPPPQSWVHDLPLLPPANPLRRLAVILLTLMAVIGAVLWATRDSNVAITPQPLPDLAKAIGWPGVGMTPHSWLA
ncbi:hypothetical protein [Sandarakinorhabdus sp.]|uniref:hypothetical protein n=1 Tax=Sandarakinorhabdus sp. TaxID=1916663 RepID=UPI00286DE5BB|nr:hypothetical protein [Sandarakinorhabdus sp.]